MLGPRIAAGAGTGAAAAAAATGSGRVHLRLCPRLRAAARPLPSADCLRTSLRGVQLARAASLASATAARAHRRPLAGRAFASVAAPATEEDAMTVTPHKEFFRKVRYGVHMPDAWPQGRSALRCGREPAPPAVCCSLLSCALRPAAAQDYQPPTHLIDTVHLTFVLADEGPTRVEAKLRVQPNHAAGERPPLFLNGREGALGPGWVGWGGRAVQRSTQRGRAGPGGGLQHHPLPQRRI